MACGVKVYELVKLKRNCLMSMRLNNWVKQPNIEK